jgi:2-methylcitrate dehydratase PrpD
MDPMEKLLAFYSSLRYEDIPRQTVDAVRALIIDTIGCALSGSSAPLNATLVERYAKWGGTPESTVLVFGNRLPAPQAAWLNAALIHSDDFDDTHDDTSIHVFVTALPAVLAAAESTNKPVSGKDFLAAITGAAEISIRLGISVRDYIHSGWLPTTVCGTLGAAAGAARIMGLDQEASTNSSGLGYAQTHGNRQALLDATLGKRLQPAFSAQAGVHAAALAEMGATGPRRIVEGADGLFELFGGGKGDSSALTDRLGEHFEVSRTSVKPYPCCRSNHGVISAAEEAKCQLGQFGTDDIESVDVWVTSYSYSMVGQNFQIRQNPQVDAQFSAQWTSAFTLLNGPPRVQDFEPKKVISDKEIQELAGQVKVHIWEGDEDTPDSNAPFRLSRVSVNLKDGRTADVTHEKVKGSPDWPLSVEERRVKFFTSAESAAVPLERARVEKAFNGLERLEELNDLRPLVQMLTAESVAV